MSLELALKENTDTMKQLIAIWNDLGARITQIKSAADDAPAPKSAAASTAVSGQHTVKGADALIATAKGITQSAASAAKDAQASTAATPDPKHAAVSQQQETAAASHASKPEASKSDATVSYDQVKVAILAMVKAKGSAAATELLKAFGVTKGPELKADQYAAVLASFKAALS